MDAHIAITEIHYAKEPGKPGNKATGEAPTRPVTGVIKAGTVFVPKNETQRKELVDAGAARKFEGDAPKGAIVLSGSEQVDTKNAIATGPDATGGKREAEAARRKAEGEAKGLDALRAEYEELAGSPPHGTMKEATLQRRIEEMRAEKEKGGPSAKDGSPVMSGTTDTARSSMSDTSAPAAEQTNPEGDNPKSGERTGSDGTGDAKAEKKAEAKKDDKGDEDLV